MQLIGMFGAGSNIEVGSRALGARDLRRAQPFLSLLLDLALPAGCPACAAPLGSGSTRFCGPCAGAMPPLSRPLCTRCGLPFVSAIADHPCGACLARPPAFRTARAAGRYEGALLDSIHRLKFAGDLVQAPALAALLPRSLASFETDLSATPAAGVLPSPLHVEIDDRPAPDLVIPVPLHLRRLCERGFNQAHVIAAEAMRADLFARWTRFAPRALARVRETPAQTRLSRPERLLNLRAAFAARSDTVRGRTVLLVDDVMTTGATLDACARALLRAGAREVNAVVVARVCP